MRNGHTQSYSKPKKRFYTDVPFTSFDPAYVIAMQSGPLGQFLLAVACGLSEAANFATEGKKVRIYLHASTVARSG